MTNPALGAVRFALRDTSRPLLVLGPSLGTAVTTLWRDVATALEDEVDVVGWDLPGHGTSPAVAPGTLDDLTVADLAAAVGGVVDRAQTERGDVGAPYWYAGVSVGGAVGQQLLLDEERLLGAAVVCTSACFAGPESWTERADLVARAGTPTQVTGAASRWFAPGFMERTPEIATALLADLQGADRFGYAAVCGALARFDVRSRLGEIGVPVLAVAGADDAATPPADLAVIADRVRRGHLVVLDGAAHLAPAERPGPLAELVRGLMRGERT